MAEDKKNGRKRQTKAGMLAKNNNQSSKEKDSSTSDKNSENTPGISKEKAEERHDDKPLH